MEFNFGIDELKIKKGKDGAYRAIAKIKIREEVDGKIKTVGFRKIIVKMTKQDIKLELEQEGASVTVSLN